MATNQSFSERQGLKKSRELLQVGAVDAALRARLWNLVHDGLLCSLYSPYGRDKSASWIFAKRLWDRFFKLPADTFDAWVAIERAIKDYFFKCAWNELYDFLEFAAREYPDSRRLTINGRQLDFREACNSVLEQEMSGYRFVGEHVAEISDEHELGEVDQALADAAGGAKVHLSSAIEKLRDRQAPDYRNAIKEAISAVEAVCRELTGESTLGPALKKLQNRAPIPEMLRISIEKLYAYTNDKSGIRHALMEDDSAGFAEAKFMLVACAAFINYVRLIVGAKT